MKEGWEKKKIKDICDKASSNVAQNKLKGIDGEYPIYGASGYIQNVDFYHRDTPYIGIVKDGSGVGRVNMYPAYSSLLGTLQYIIPKNGYEIGYLKYALQGLNLSSFANGIAIPHIYFKDYGECEILVPPLSIQQQIVSELDLLSGIIEKQKKQLNELDNLAQSIFYQMFGNPVENEMGWEVKKMNEIAEITSSKRIFANEYQENGVPFYRGKEVSEKSKGLPISVELYISEERYNEIKDEFGIPELGDILITAVGTIGNIWVVDNNNPFYFKDGNIIWLKNINDDINPIYFRFILQILINAYKSEMANGCAYNALTIVNLKKMFVSLPPYSFQQEFAQKIQSIEHQKQLITSSLQESENFFNSRMDYYFN